jgi:hypothetical protein
MIADKGLIDVISVRSLMSSIRISIEPTQNHDEESLLQ